MKEVFWLFLSLILISSVFALPLPPDSPDPNTITGEQETVSVSVPATRQVQQTAPAQQVEDEPKINQTLLDIIAEQERQQELELEQAREEARLAAEAQQKKEQMKTNLYWIIGFAVLMIVVLIGIKIMKDKTLFQKKPVQASPAVIQLRNYIAQTMQQGFTKEQITATLLQHGYEKQMIDEAMKYV